MSLPVVDGEILMDEGRMVHEPLSEYLRRYNATDLKKQEYLSSAMALLNAEDSQYDAVPLSYMEIKKRD